MKTNVIVNYLLMAVAWIFYINFSYVMAFITIVLASILLFIKMRKMNWLRMALVFASSLVFFSYISALVTVCDFYAFFFEFSLFLSINIALTYEMENKTSGNLNPLNSIFSLVMMIFFVIAILLPDAWYSIFTKSSLYALISFIFIPYEACLALVILRKQAGK